MSYRRIVNKRVEDTYQCERKFSEVHYLSRHRREEHGPRVHYRHCSASFPRCRIFQLRCHEEQCQQQIYRPRGRICLEHESQGQCQSPRGDGGSRRPRSRSPKPERYDKFASSRNQSAKSRSHARKHESPQTTTSEDTNDFPASPQLSIDFSNNPFYNDNVVNLFTKLDLETSAASSNLEGIMNSCNFLSEEPQQTFPYNIFQSDPAVPLSSDLTYQLDQNQNLKYLTASTPFQTETDLDSMTGTDDGLPPPPPPEKSDLSLPPAPVTQFLELPDFDEPLPPPPTDEQTKDSPATATNRTEDMTTMRMTTASDYTTTGEQTTDSPTTATNRTEDMTTMRMTTTSDCTTTDEQTTDSPTTATNKSTASTA